MVLFDPIRIGGMELRNRIVMPSIECFFEHRQMMDFYEERSRGGVGLIIFGTTSIDEKESSGINAYSDEFIPELGELAEVIHAHGAKTGLQLWHPGRYSFFSQDPVSASDVASPIFTRQKPRPLDMREIEEMGDKFAEAALRVKKAGFDCVEIIASTGYLISQFLSPSTNKREDRYGGTLDNRMRFLLEIVEKTRGKIGDFPLQCRISGDEFVPEGNNHEDQKIIAKNLERAGVDALNVNVGWHESRIDQMSMMVPRGGFIHLAAGIKEVVDIPVIASHRINDPILAEKLLEEGKADLVAMARSLIADPELPNKAREGRYDEIRTCIACNRCFDNLFEGGSIICMVNPAVGREKEYQIKETESPKKVIIIGGGPGGMEAARITSLRGHDVILYEKSNSLGGQINLITACKEMCEFENIKKYYENQLKNVRIEFNKEPSPHAIIEKNPDVVIVATGALPAIPDIPGVDGKNVTTAFSVLGGEEIGEEILVIGGGGVGCDVALYLKNKKKRVTILEMLDKIGVDIGGSIRWIVKKKLKEAGVSIKTGTKVVEIVEGGVIVEKEGKRYSIGGETVVLAVGTVSNRGLYDELSGKIPNLQIIGDAAEPRKVLEAIHEGAEIARRI